MEILNDARDRRTDGRTDGWIDGWTGERTNERYGEIRSGTVGGPSRLASIHSPPNSLDLGISFSSRTLSLSLSSSRRSGSSLPRFPSTSRFQHPPHLPVAVLSTFSGASLRRSLALTPFPLPFFSSPSFRRIFVASFSPHHSLAVILHHLPAVLTSRSTALRFNAGRVHGTPRRCQHTIRLLSTTPAADTASVYTTSPPQSTSTYTCTGLFRAGVARSLRAMR